MKRSLSILGTVSLVALAACAHAPPPAAASPDAPSTNVTTTSAEVSRTSAELEAPSYLPLQAQEGVRAGPSERIGAPPVDSWAGRYPDAATELGRWILSHPETARALAKWQERHPEKMEVLVDWSLTHMYESLGAFLFDRTGWSDLQDIAGESDGLHGFMDWIRRAPAAATELSAHTDGVTFADQHAESLARMSEKAASSGYSRASVISQP